MAAILKSLSFLFGWLSLMLQDAVGRLKFRARGAGLKPPRLKSKPGQGKIQPIRALLSQTDGFSLGLALSLLVMATQCNSSAGLSSYTTPPLPASPAGPVLRFALLIPSTGELATFGRMLRNGSLMAADEWNNRGGVLAHRLEGVEYDTACDFEVARQITQQAIADGFQFIIGPLCSESAIAAAEVAQAGRALLIAPAATHPLVTVNGAGQTRPTVFRAAFGWAWQGQTAASFAHTQLGASRAALFFDPGDDYSRTLADSFAEQFERLGGKMVYRAAYDPAETDFKPDLQAGQAAGAELIYLPASASTVNRVAGQWRELGLSGPQGLTLLGSDGWDSPELDRAAVEGSYFTTHFFLAASPPEMQPWVEAYKASYAVAPPTLAVLGYEATAILASGIEQAGSFETQAVATAIGQGRFAGVAGPFRFDGQHNPLKPVPVVQIKHGQMIFSALVSP